MGLLGVLGGEWRAEVTAWGGIEPWDGSAPLDWAIAADDRWHVPRDEQAVRQVRVEGTPVYETRVRIPGGDAVQRVHATAHDGGLTVVEVENDSSLPIAVAFTRPDLLTSRPPTEVPVHGIELPEGSIVLPVGHRSSVVVALAHDGRGAGSLPDEVPTARAVARGWTSLTERASRLVLPDPVWAERVVAERCEVALGAGWREADRDPVGFVLAVGEAIRMGEHPDAWVPDLAGVVERLARDRAGSTAPWDVARAALSLSEVLSLAHEHRALDDLDDLRRRLGTPATPPPDIPARIRAVAWIEDRLVRPDVDGRCTLLAEGLPGSWVGSPVEAYRLPAGGGHHVSFAVRWHGERPALLWETSGPAGLVLDGGGLDPSWHSTEPRGEALLAPVRLSSPGESTSFS